MRGLRWTDSVDIIFVYFYVLLAHTYFMIVRVRWTPKEMYYFLLIIRNVNNNIRFSKMLIKYARDTYRRTDFENENIIFFFALSNRGRKPQGRARKTK